MHVLFEVFVNVEAILHVLNNISAPNSMVWTLSSLKLSVVEDLLVKSLVIPRNIPMRVFIQDLQGV